MMDKQYVREIALENGFKLKKNMAVFFDVFRILVFQRETNQ